MKQLLITIIILGTLHGEIFSKNKYNFSIGYQIGGNLSFTRNNKLTAPYVYQLPTIYPTAGFNLSTEVNKKHLFTFSYLYLSYGVNLKFNSDPSQRGKGTLSTSSLEHQLSSFYRYRLLQKFIDIHAGMGMDYYNTKDRSDSTGWSLGTTQLGIIGKDEISYTEHSMSILPSVTFSKSYRHGRASLNLAYRFGFTKLITAKYDFYKNGVPEEQYINNYGDMFIFTMSFEYWLKRRK